MPQNFIENPASQIEKVFTDIHHHQMNDLPFINDKLEVKTVGFALYEGDWLGVLLTPWTLSIMLLPGEGREWRSFDMGEKVGIQLPAGDYTFIYGEHEQLGHYLSCSVQSPVQDFGSQEDAVRVAEDVRRLITAIPTSEIADKSKRNLFSKLASGQPALESE
ncbi:[NiFe]-hydrogenase assembly chaperone HybE [Vibrio sp. JC009]|uniref:[NiFe]-hydrogenase assembly chaperone HybE n=1 Tax=Vibrio sp. JC009 TaxID=2912314 RepID=UPI0023B081F0|nr:[NiFe]-hydrogenase assembly chaperone HybE [Vibrio sp. JC009]WED21725.1 [NiFe]-hydrogenase assembly chaperone HybE [Vibrio sp. JC009]